MNVRALRKVQKQILAEPEGFDMAVYHGKNECGTTHCIGGYAALNAKLVAPVVGPEGTDYVTTLKAKKAPICPGSTLEAAAYALGIRSDAALRLFFVFRWPEKFQGAYERAKTHRGKASVAARRIDHFIATKGAE